MARYTSIEHLRFLLFDVHGVQDLFFYDYFAHLDREQVALMIDSAKALADRDMYPFFREMDEQGVHYAGDGVVWSHPQLKTIIHNAAEQSWISGEFPFDLGGLQLPQMVYNAAHHIFQAANNGTQGYISLTTGAARLIHNYGTPEQAATYLPPMFDGRWQGTMALTEPQAGSSLTDITTTAKPTASGYYEIKGQKIFISAGEHMACENFVHLTLARIDGAPPGLRGVSLFIIPKHRPTAEGGLEYNDVFCAGDYQKLGQRAYATTHLVFGENDNCRGWLVGEPHKGLSYMFQLMNEARIGVGQTASSVAMAAYLASLQYARERSQGRKPGEKDPLQPPIPIIRHADVQRMLFTQKAIVEGALSLAMECNRLADLVRVTEGEAQKPHWLLLEILTPVVKTYSSEQGNRATSLAIQVLGGYGYTVDFPQQQYYRDLRIMPIYEGTTGIQSLDLLGRKMTMENGAALLQLAEHIGSTISQAAAHPALQPYANTLQIEMNRMGRTLRQLGEFARQGDTERYLADATIFMEMAGYIIIAWQWLKMAIVAQKALDAADFSTQSRSFYEGKVHTMQFFFRYVLPHAAACSDILLAEGALTQVEGDEVLD